MPAISPKQPWTHETDDGERFHIKPPTRARFFAFLDQRRADGESTALYLLVRDQLDGWDNVKDASGELVPWVKGDADANLERLDPGSIIGLGHVISAACVVGEEDAKN